jgi:hypothetical protein
MKYRMSENNLFQEIQEDLDRQKMEALWRSYGPLVLMVAIVIILGTAATTAWRSWDAKREQQATGDLIKINDITGDQVKQIEALQDFAQKNHTDTQASFALIHAGALEARAGDITKAVAIYDGVANDSKADAAFRQLADLYAVEVQLDTGNAAALEKRLQPLLAENAPWRFSAMEYDGYLALRTGDKAKAKQIFTELSQNASVPQSLGSRAAVMLRYVND